MKDDFEEQAWVKMGVAAALVKQYAAEQRNMLETLAQVLEQGIPGQTEIERRGGLFAKKAVRRVSFTLGQDRYTLEDRGRPALAAMRTHVVGGIALKSEEIPVESWLDALGAELEERARTSADARNALARFIE